MTDEDNCYRERAHSKDLQANRNVSRVAERLVQRRGQMARALLFARLVTFGHVRCNEMLCLYASVRHVAQSFADKPDAWSAVSLALLEARSDLRQEFLDYVGIVYGQA